MKYKHPKISGFTLIEIIVALTIFSMIMISVMSIFYLASQMSTRIELNRYMQENIKNAMEIMAEDIRQNSIRGGSGIDGLCNDSFTQGEVSNKLCLDTDITTLQFTLGKFNDSTGEYEATDDCVDLMSKNCHIIKTVSDASDYFPLTNHKSHITRLNFRFLNESQPKVQITVGIRPALRQGLTPELIESEEIIIQTTLSERYIPIISN